MKANNIIHGSGDMFLSNKRANTFILFKVWSNKYNYNLLLLIKLNNKKNYKEKLIVDWFPGREIYNK